MNKIKLLHWLVVLFMLLPAGLTLLICIEGIHQELPVIAPYFRYWNSFNYPIEEIPGTGLLLFIFVGVAGLISGCLILGISYVIESYQRTISTQPTYDD